MLYKQHYGREIPFIIQVSLNQMTDMAVIMAVYKNDKLKFLEEAVLSILHQTYRNFHFYLVKDGPVPEELDSCLKRITDERIRLFSLEVNDGLARALNFLLEKIMIVPSYEFITRMDADDISDPERFEKQRRFLIGNSEISCIGSWYREINESGGFLSNRKMPVVHDDIKRAFCIKTPVAHPSVMFRRRLVETAGSYPTDTVLMEDTALWARALAQGLRFANLPEYLLMFRRDREFYKRRSGIIYGWNYIKTRFRINRSLDTRFFCYIASFCAGIIKMMPPRLVEFFYYIERRIENLY